MVTVSHGATLPQIVNVGIAIRRGVALIPREETLQVSTGYRWQPSCGHMCIVKTK